MGLGSVESRFEDVLDLGAGLLGVALGLLDAALGMGILGAAVILLSTAAVIVNYTSTAGVWVISAVLILIGIGCQIVGHRLFERRQPALE